ncbi:MAG: ATP-binding cassette domain-containing protein [Sulfolobales archaeon]
MSEAKAPIIEARDIWAVYPGGYTALSGVDLSIYEGEIHVILGENGAGKTTLLKILSGYMRPTAGEIRIDGEKVFLKSPRVALEKGISMAYQGSSLIGELTVEENISIISRSCRMNPRGILKNVENTLGKMGLREIDPSVKVSNLSPSERQLLEVLIAVAVGRRVILLDEPTSLLSPEISKEILRILRKVSMDGKAVVMTNHKIREVIGFGDRFTILKRGLKVAEVGSCGECFEEFFPHVINNDGQGSVAGITDSSIGNGEEILSAKDLTVIDDRGIYVMRGASFKVSRREVVAIVSLDGRGVREIAETIYGIRSPLSGEIWVKPGSRISYVPSDTERGSVMSMSIAINASMRRLLEKPLRIGDVLISHKDLRSYAESLIRESSIKVPSIWSSMRSLSGGNARRLVIWREALRKPDLIIFEEPLANLDISSIELLKELIKDLAMRGSAVVIITSDPEDLKELRCRVFFLREGALVGLEKSQVQGI